MKSNPSIPKSLVIISVTAVIIILYVLIITIKIPYSFSAFFSNYSPVFFLISFLFFSISFRPHGWKGWIAGLAVTIVLFALPLAYKWTSGFSNNRIIAGLIPYKDQFYYYTGAREVLSGNLIPSSFSQATWRPLFPAFLSSLLFLTGHNLKWSLAVFTFLVGVACYLSGRQIKNLGGNWAAGLYMTLLYFYANYYIGLVGTELAGLAIACLAFAILISAARNLDIRSLLFGIPILMVAICTRAGAFFIFPMIVIWSGWVFRKEKKYSFKVAGESLLVVIVSFFVFTSFAQKILVEPGSDPLGNFAYTLYGQALGGIGWNRAVQDLGPDTRLVFSTALEIIQKHPLSILIASAKSFRDVLLPGREILIPFSPSTKPVWANLPLWILCFLCLAWGGIKIIKEWRKPFQSFLLVSIIGIILSVPFLPPIDGGARFYTSVAPFIVILPAIGLGEILSRWEKSPAENDISMITAIKGSGILIAFLIICVPLLLKLFRSLPDIVIPTCNADQIPFAIQVDPDSFVDIVPTQTTGYGVIPEISLGDFKANGYEPWDDFYQALVSRASSSNVPIRILAAADLIGKGLHFFIGDAALLPSDNPGRIISGCAGENKTQYQSIYVVESVSNGTP
jgi:hypothetical protein